MTEEKKQNRTKQYLISCNFKTSKSFIMELHEFLLTGINDNKIISEDKNSIKITTTINNTTKISIDNQDKIIITPI